MAKEEKLYNVTELAKELGVTRQTIHLWIKKGWVKTKRDYRNYPVFTRKNVEEIIEWKNMLRE